MATWLLIAAAAALQAAPRAQTPPREVTPHPGEMWADFADRALGLRGHADPHVHQARWNGQSVIFADVLRGEGDDQERPVTALLQETPGGPYRRIEVTVGEQEGGAPEIAAIGFANADRDPAKELIVILAWRQIHYDVRGTLYEVRIFDDPKPGQTQLAELKAAEQPFQANRCDCERRDGPTEHFRFKTMAAIKAELKRRGF